MTLSLGCGATCSPGPNIRTQPGLDYCAPFCQKMKDMDCKPYYEDIALDDGGTMTCVEFCQYELKNSVPLDPQCVVDNVTKCEEVETKCPGQ